MKTKAADILRKFFHDLRFDKDHHLGIGDVRVTFGQRRAMRRRARDVEFCESSNRRSHQRFVPPSGQKPNEIKALASLKINENTSCKPNRLCYCVSSSRGEEPDEQEAKIKMKLYTVLCREGESSPLCLKVVAGKSAAIKAAKEAHNSTENTVTEVLELGDEINFFDGGVPTDVLENEIGISGTRILKLDWKTDGWQKV